MSIESTSWQLIVWIHGLRVSVKCLFFLRVLGFKKRDSVAGNDFDWLMNLLDYKVSLIG